MQTKKWYKSKSIWTFFILLVASVLTASGVYEVGDLSPEAGWVGIVLNIIGLVLRAVTGTGLEAKKNA